MKTSTQSAPTRKAKRLPVIPWEKVTPGQYLTLCPKGREYAAFANVHGALKEISRSGMSEAPLHNSAGFKSSNTFRLEDGVIRTFNSWSIVDAA